MQGHVLVSIMNESVSYQVSTKHVSQANLTSIHMVDNPHDFTIKIIERQRKKWFKGKFELKTYYTGSDTMMLKS